MQISLRTCEPSPASRHHSNRNADFTCDTHTQPSTCPSELQMSIFYAFGRKPKRENETEEENKRREKTEEENNKENEQERKKDG